MQPLPFKYPSNATLVKLADVDFADRARKDYGDITSLQQQILTHGLIHPPTVVAMPDGKYKLAAGGRRTTVFRIMSLEYIPVSIRTDDLTEHELLEIELVENTGRKDFTWQEEVMLIARAHECFKQTNPDPNTKWGQAHTGKLFKVSRSHVAHALLVAVALKENNEEVLASNSIAEAYSALLKQKEHAVTKQLSTIMKQATRTAPPKAVLELAAKPSPNIVVTGGKSMDDLFDLNIDMTTPAVQNSTKDNVAQVSDWFDGRTDFPLSEWFRQGDCLKLMADMPDASVDHIITDPPYGIDITEDFLNDTSEIEDTHDRASNLAMFPEMLKQFYRVLRNNSYCLMFFDYEHYELLTTLARSVGFRVQIHPLIWHKTHPCKNAALQQNFTKNH